MSYSVSNTLPANPATGSLNSQTVNLWLGSRFSPVNTPPATNGSPPSGSADYGPYTTNTSSDGFWTFTVTSILSTDEFIISTFNSTDTSNGGTYNTYWLGPYLINPSTNQVGWTLATTPVRHVVLTTVTAASNGAVLPQSTISVASTTGFSALGFLMVTVSSFRTVVQYAGKTATTFTGCTLGSGTLATGNQVTEAFQAGNYRRLCFVAFRASVAANGDAATITFYSTIAGSAMNPAAYGGLFSYAGTTSETLGLLSTFPVDPGGYYSPYGSTTGTGALVVDYWTEVDF